MRKLTSVIISLLLIITAAILPLIPNFTSAQPVEYITIKADGSIEPANAPINRNGDSYTVTGDMSQYLVLERNYTALNGDGHHVGGIYGPLVVQDGYDYIVNGTTNMTITNVVIDGKGIVFISTINSHFSYITLNNGTGMDVSGDRNTITNITVNYGRGLSIGGKSNLVSDNRFNDCNYTFAENNPPPFGISVGGSNNIVIKNYITGTIGSAINLGTSRDNIIFGNQIENNKVGIRTMTIYSQNKAENNTIYNNNFVSNQKNLHDEMIMTAPPSDTIWDYNTIGNYWSNYNGLDTNGDGKGDTPYVIDEDNQDNYPLMNPVDIAHVSNPPTPYSTDSPTPTVTSTQPTSTLSTESLSPTVPELSWLVIVPLLLSVLSFAVVLRHQKTSKKKQ